MNIRYIEKYLFIVNFTIKIRFVKIEEEDSEIISFKFIIFPCISVFIIICLPLPFSIFQFYNISLY